MLQVGLIREEKRDESLISLVHQGPFEVYEVVLDHHSRDFDRVDALVSKLALPRIVGISLVDRAVREDVLRRLARAMVPGDLVIETSDLQTQDLVDAGKLFAKVVVGYLDASVAGSLVSPVDSAPLCVGTHPDYFEMALPILTTLAMGAAIVRVSDNPGSGRYAMMVLEAIECGVIQALKEGYQALGASELEIGATELMQTWSRESAIASPLLAHVLAALQQHGDFSGIVESAAARIPEEVFALGEHSAILGTLLEPFRGAGLRVESM